jgi:hypothetical protein
MQQYDIHETMPQKTLPGSDLISAGLEDLRRGIHSIPALLVSIGAPRLRRLGYQVPNPLPDPEHRLYDLLRQADPDAAHSRYNALVRRLASFERAAEHLKHGSSLDYGESCGCLAQGRCFLS